MTPANLAGLGTGELQLVWEPWSSLPPPLPSTGKHRWHCCPKRNLSPLQGLRRMMDISQGRADPAQGQPPTGPSLGRRLWLGTGRDYRWGGFNWLPCICWHWQCPQLPQIHHTPSPTLLLLAQKFQADTAEAGTRARRTNKQMTTMWSQEPVLRLKGHLLLQLH